MTGPVRTGLRRTATLAICAALTACAVSREAEGPAPEGLFRADGRLAAGIAPGPRAIWYAGAKPHYFEIGLADWRDTPAAPPHRLGRWLQRLIGPRSPRPRQPVALIDAHATLPLPSIVEVANLQTGASIRVRIERRAQLRGELIRLPVSVAAQLGADPGRALMVRVRYAAPALAYDDRGALRLAWAAPHRPPTFTPAPPPSVQRATAPHTPALDALRPLRAALVAPPQPTPDLRPRGALATPRLEAGAFEIEAGAFADPANARRAAARLTDAGLARVEELQSRGRRLYLVIVAGAPSAEAARALRARVAAQGFPDAILRRD